MTRYRVPCLLCSEAKPDKCHRRLVAEYWAAHLPGLRIVHLVSDAASCWRARDEEWA